MYCLKNTVRNIWPQIVNNTFTFHKPQSLYVPACKLSVCRFSNKQGAHQTTFTSQFFSRNNRAFAQLLGCPRSDHKTYSDYATTTGLPKDGYTNDGWGGRARRHAYRRGGGPAGGHGAAVLGTQLRQGVLGHVSALLGVFQFVLYLAVLGQVDGGDLLLQEVFIDPIKIYIKQCSYKLPTAQIIQ